MASPWKLLARLVSPRRQQRREHGSTDDVKPDVLAIAKPTETAADNGLNATDPKVDEKPVAYEQSEAVPAAPDPGAAAHDALKSSQTGEGATRKRSTRHKKTEPIEAVPPPSLGVPAVSDDAIRLDEEIRLLRDQLARKLQLQNAQLKRMLERFER
ncbi:hypothetical protein [Neorhizobium sp. T25_13]|uniref:hypothetical protein n=1 Tax=Neorhizobium sp. T25_13 TaxID=2093830 RepID=UPI000CF98630|nr:hypothetical protein [Neorhizobium sp. T25_13]